MKLLELSIQQTEGDPLRIGFSKGINKIPKISFFSSTSLSDVLADLFFSKNFLLSGINQIQLDFELFQKKYRVLKDYVHQKVDISLIGEPNVTVALNDVLSSSVIKGAEVMDRFLTCRLDYFLDSAPIESQSSSQADRLQSLRAELDVYYKFDDLSNQLDAAQSELFAIQEKINQLKSPMKRMKELKLEYEEYEVFDKVEISGDLIEKVKNFSKLEDLASENLEKIEQSLLDKYEVFDTLPRGAWYVRKEVWVGVVLSLVLFTLTAVFRENVWILYLGLIISVLPMGLVIHAMMKANEEEEAVQRCSVEIKTLEQKKSVFQKKYESERSPVLSLFAKIGIEDAAEILQMLNKKKEILSEQSELTQDLKKLLEGKGYDEWVASEKGAQSKIKNLEQQMANLPHLTSDINSIQIEIENLEKNLGMDSSSFLGKIPQNSIDEVERLFSLSSFAISVPEEKLIQALLKNIEKTLLSLTQGKVSSLMKSEKSWIFQSGSRYLPIEEFEPSIRQAIYFSVQYVLWQMISQRFSMFCMIDMDVVSKSSTKPLLERAVTQLSDRIQFILFVKL